MQLFHFIFTEPGKGFFRGSLYVFDGLEVMTYNRQCVLRRIACHEISGCESKYLRRHKNIVSHCRYMLWLASYEPGNIV